MRIHGLSLREARDVSEKTATVAAASQAGVFRALATEPETPEALSRRLGLDLRAVEILLPALESLGFLELDEGRYGPTPEVRRGLGDPDHPDFEGGGLPLWLNNLQARTELPRVLRRGGPVEERPPEEERDEASVARFMAAMAAAPRERVEAVVDACLRRRPGARSVLDLGGGPGLMARAFIRRGLRTTLLDTPATIRHVAEAYDLADEEDLRLVPGDFLEDPLPEGPFDVALLSNVLHIYDPERNRRLLRKVADVLAPGGVAAVADFVRGRSPRAPLFGLVMLLKTEGGNTYSLEEYRRWLTEAGFEDVEMEDLDPERQLVTALRSEGASRGG